MPSQLMVDRARNGRPTITAIITTISIVVAALTSVTVQGFVFGINNNVFHIPLALRLADDPIFANDQFIQSLKHFTSLVWVAVQQVATDNNVELVFFTLHLATRAASLVTLVWAVRELGVRGVVSMALLAFWFGLVPSLRWEPPIGAGEIFSIYFSHSAMAIPLSVACITLGTRRKYLLAFAALGLIANANAFISVWIFVALLGMLCGEYDRFKDAALSALAGMLVAAILALPVALWIYTTIEGHEVSGAERFQFLREYFPSHSLIEGTSAKRLILFGGVAVSGLIGFRLLGARATAWFRALIALCVMVVLGMLLPEVLHSRFLLDLHLIRASAIIQLLAVLGLTAAALAALRADQPISQVGGFLALCFLALPALQGMLLAAAVLLSAKDERWAGRDGVSVGLVSVAILTAEIWDNFVLLSVSSVVAVAFLVLKGNVTRVRVPARSDLSVILAGLLTCVALYTCTVHRYMQSAPDWEDARDAAHWARSSTPTDALFLVPEAPFSDTTSLFESLSRRRIWVDWKRGGAAMWAPTYYGEWSKRMAEVARLVDLTSKLSYACANNIDYVLVGPETKPGPRTLAPVYSNEHFRIFGARSWCSSKT